MAPAGELGRSPASTVAPMTAIDWLTLSHAYGPAGDVPVLLARARRAAAPRHFQDEPWISLWSALCHQGDVYTASYAAVPELIAIAEARVREPRAALECLYLAAMIDLERAASESLTPPPPIPGPLQAPYEAALRRGATVAGQLSPDALAPEWRPALVASAAVFHGAYSEAGAVVDPPEEDEDAQ